MTEGLPNEAPATEKPAIPHHKVVAGMSFAVLAAFGAVTVYVLVAINDATIRGSVIGAWTAYAGAAVQFWIGSSSGGKLAK